MKPSSDTQSPVTNPWLAWIPAYIALGCAIGSAVLGLSAIFDSPAYVNKLWIALALALAVSYCVKCGGRTTREICAWILVVLLAFLPPLVVVMHRVTILPGALMDDSNAMVAATMGWVVIASVFMAGLSLGSFSVPLTAPLVPTLSLFGLMNIMSINPLANLLFLTFVGSSLFLGAYERAIKTNELKVGQTVSAATKALGACMVWLLAFSLGGAIFFRPVTAALPTSLSIALSHAPVPSQRQNGDFRTSPPVVELKGGNYPLSNRTVAHVSIVQGESSGLWRINIYSRYTGSRWRETSDFSSHSVFTKSGVDSILANRQKYTFETSFVPPPRPERNLSMNACSNRDCSTVTESVQPVDSDLGGIISSGQAQTLNGDLGELQVHNDGTVDVSEPSRRTENYIVRSQMLNPNLGLLLTSAGISDIERNRWLADPNLSDTLVMPDDEAKTKGLRTIAIKVLKDAVEAHHDIDTPARKVIAISDYLVKNCYYSLSSPAVPDNTDAVLFFLNHSKRGACDMFSSSMALLLRTMGVPSRLVTGYLQPETADNEDNTNYTLRERDAHAWVQYYVPRYGWLDVDATERTRSLDAPGNDSTLFGSATLGLIVSKGFVPISAVLLIGLALSFLGPRKKRARKAKAGAEDLTAEIAHLYRLGRAATRRHVSAGRHWTPLEYEAAVMASALPHPAKLEFAALTYLFIESQYSGNATQVEKAEIEKSLLRLREALRGVRKPRTKPTPTATAAPAPVK